MRTVRRSAAGSTIEPRIVLGPSPSFISAPLRFHISLSSGESERWRNSGVQSHYRNLPPFMHQFTTTPTWNATSTTAKTSRLTVRRLLPTKRRALMESGVASTGRRRDEFRALVFSVLHPGRRVSKSNLFIRTLDFACRGRSANRSHGGVPRGARPWRFPAASDP